jgi:hypothetical protein
MRKIYLALPLFLIVLFACRKDNNKNLVHGLVKMKTDSTSNTWVVEILNPDASKQSFLCDKMNGMLSSLYYNCGNAVFITNLPAGMRVAETKIVFSKWKDNTGSTAPTMRMAHQLEVYDVAIDF